jgi:hypothetical protein
MDGGTAGASKRVMSSSTVILDLVQIARFCHTKIDSFSSTIKDQLSYSKKIESQLAQLATALPFATNLKKVNAITIRGGKSTRDSLYPTRTGRTPVVVQDEEKRNDEVEDIGPQERELQQDFYDTTFLLFPCRNRRAKMDE